MPLPTDTTDQRVESTAVVVDDVVGEATLGPTAPLHVLRLLRDSAGVVHLCRDDGFSACEAAFATSWNVERAPEEKLTCVRCRQFVELGFV